MKPTILLFDIDGTLITTGGAGRRAMERAFASLHARPDAVYFRMDGMTDRLIVKQGLATIGAVTSDAAVMRVLEAYVAALREEVALVPNEHYRVHAGMREAVALGRERGAAVGLGTGNVQEGALVKLGRVGFYEPFAFGGFGSDADERAHVLQIGAERGAAQLGAPVADCRVVVIGDTPKDVAAAQCIGAECIAVATGNYSTDALLASGASAAFTDLTVAGALEAMLGR